MFKSTLQKCLLALLTLILLVCTTIKTQSGYCSNGQYSGQIQKPTFLIPAIARQDKPVTLIVVQGDDESRPSKTGRDEWLVAAAAPASAKIRQLNKTPILLKCASEENPRQTKLFNQLAQVSGFCTILSSDSTFTLGQTQDNLTTYNITIKSEPAEMSLFLAGHYWQKADSVVVASRDDPEAVILGSALASHLYAPLVVISPGEQLSVLSEKLSSLGVGDIIYVTSKASLADAGIRFPAQKTEIINVEEAQRRLIETLGPANIQNIILFRVPDESSDEESVSWLAPYLSLIHRAALVPCYSSDPLAAESKIGSVIRRYSLRPRTLTILGDYEAIDLITITIGNEPNTYEISSEPCSRLSQGQAAEMGVGRIPLRQLWAASTFIAYGVAREHILGREQPNALMIANPSPDYSELPLCETISRATANEFKNFGIRIKEFYHTSCNDQLIRGLVGNSQLIIYEGHLSDFTLFEERSTYQDEEYVSTHEYGHGQSEDYTDTTDFADNHTDDYDDGSGGEPSPSEGQGEDSSNSDDIDKQVQSEQVDSSRPVFDGRDSTFEPFERDVHSRPDEISQSTPCELEGIPLVLIQSCHSLDETLLDTLTSGVVGIVGSKTNVHSASGSAFIKAFCDGLLYKSDTTGEALRDAKNYLLCVSALKKARGHTQYAKVERVAYTFHLWGDPELRLYNGLQNSQRIKAVSAGFVEPDKISITIPTKRLSTSRTEKYFLRMFPGSEAAGILKRLKGKEIRRVAPMYFFRIPMPKGFEPTQYAGLKKSDDTTVQALFFVDSFKRFLYIVYFPEKEEKERVFTLQFIKRNLTVGTTLKRVRNVND
ncbi:MAG: C25 family cysteine peptidase [Sedimentisphaerales bacterium]